MLRRALAVAFAAASLALVPATASATPEQAPVSTFTGSSYSGYAQFQLEDGRQVSAGISQYRDNVSDVWQPSLYLWISSPEFCYPAACEGTGYASVQLSADQVDFDRGMREFVLPETTVMLQRGSWGGPVVEEEVTVSLVFTGTGDVNRWAEHGKLCGDGERQCESIRNYANRDALASLTLNGDEYTAPGQMQFVHGIDAAIPPFEYPEGY